MLSKLLITIVLHSILFLSFAKVGFTQNIVNVEGAIIPPFEGETINGVTVVLLKFTLNEQGQPSTTGPENQTLTDENGRFTFTISEPDYRAAYRVGSRYNQELISSDFFFLKPENTSITVEIRVPTIIDNEGQLRIWESSLFIESGLGFLTMTEVLLIENSVQDRIDTTNSPLIWELPKHFSTFRMLQKNQEDQQGYQLLGSQLHLQQIFPSGRSNVVFQYTIPARFGSYTLRKRFPQSVTTFRLLTPEGQLEISSPALRRTPGEQIGEQLYIGWESRKAPSNMKIEITNIIVRQSSYWYVSGGVFIALGILVVIFFKFRLSKEQQA